MLEVTEIFSSLQGEGPYMGRPAFFIRLSRCVEPCCPWCDTPEALLPGRAMSVSSLLDHFTAARVKLAVITGGEPFRQWGEDLQALEGAILNGGAQVQYETSGKLLIPPESRGYTVCSPKLLAGTWYFKKENVPFIDAYKFVVVDEFSEVQGFIRANRIAADKVWVMPRGATRDQQIARSGAVWDFCVENNFNYSARLHTIAFDRRKGV